MRTFQETMADVLAFTPQAFAALGAHLKPEWLIEALLHVVWVIIQVPTPDLRPYLGDRPEVALHDNREHASDW